MIQIQPDVTHQRVVLREGSRILGELIYQVECGGELLSAVQIEGDEDWVSVELTGRILDEDESVLVTDQFERGESQVTVHRSWRLPKRGSFRVQVDFRSYSDGPRLGILPGVAVCDFHDRSPSPQFASPIHLLSCPGAVVSSDVDASGLLLVDGDLEILRPSVHIYESQHRQAIQIQCPGVSHLVRSQLSATDDARRGGSAEERAIAAQSIGVDSTVRLSFSLFLNESTVGAALLRLEECGWKTAEPGDPALVPSLSHFRTLKMRHLDRHVHRDRRGCYGLRPARDDRRRRSPGIYSGLAPYWSLVAARAFAQEGRRSAAAAYSSEAREICQFFLGGKRSDELFSDSFDPATKRWGSVVDGAFHPGEASIRSTATLGRLIAETYAELRAGRVDAVELSTGVGDLSSALIGMQEPDGLWARGDALASAEVVALLVRMEAIKGRNSIRRSVIKGCARPLCETISRSDTLERIARERDSLLTVLRGLIDLARYVKEAYVIGLAREIAGLLASWVFSAPLVFPDRSAASRVDLRTVGLSACGTSRTHLDFEGLPVAYELARMHALGGDNLFEAISKRMLLAHLQAVGGGVRVRNLEEGGQPAEVDYTNWSSRRRGRNSAGSMLGARIGQSAGALYAVTLIIENYPGIANFFSSSA